MNGAARAAYFFTPRGSTVSGRHSPRAIIASRSKLLIHASNGASELLSDLLAAGELELDPQSTLSLPGDRHRQWAARLLSRAP